MKKIKSYPVKPSLPDNFGFKSDPTAQANIASVNGVQCSGETMMEKRKLPLKHDVDYTEGDREGKPRANRVFE